MRLACPRSAARSVMPVCERDAARHAVEEIQVVLVADELEEPELRRHVLARHDEHALFARADGDVRALLDDALFDDLAALHEADAEHLGAGDLRHRAHHRGHLTGPTAGYRTTTCKGLLCHRTLLRDACRLTQRQRRILQCS